MTRKDNDKEAERPHYYSQFWLDVAAGRRIIGLPKTNEDGDGAETEVLEAAAPRRASRVSPAAVANESDDDYSADDGIEPLDEVEPNALVETEADEDNVDDLDLVVDDVDAEEEPDLADEEEEEDFFEDEEEDEEDEDGSWGPRGRKKAKPTKKPVVKKPGKRDTRRGF